MPSNKMKKISHRRAKHTKERTVKDTCKDVNVKKTKDRLDSNVSANHKEGVEDLHSVFSDIYMLL